MATGKSKRTLRFNLRSSQRTPSPSHPARQSSRETLRLRVPSIAAPPLDQWRVHPENYLDTVTKCTMYDLIMVDIPAPPLFGGEDTVKKSTRDPAKTDINIPDDKRLEYVIFARFLVEQYFPATKALLQSIVLDLTTVRDWDIAVQICPSLTKRALPPVMQSEKDTEFCNRLIFDSPALFILRFLLTHVDRDGAPLASNGGVLTELERNIPLPYVSSAPGSYSDASGLSRRIIPDGIHVMRVRDHPMRAKNGQTYPEAFVVREDKTHHVVPLAGVQDPLEQFRVQRRDIPSLMDEVDDGSVPGLRFVSPASIAEGRGMGIGSKIMSQVSATMLSNQMFTTDPRERSSLRVMSTQSPSIF